KANCRPIRTNADADGELLEHVAAPDAAGRKLLTDAAEKFRLTARGYHRVLRVAPTLADLDAAYSVRRPHIAEALSYRRVMLRGGSWRVLLRPQNNTVTITPPLST